MYYISRVGYCELGALQTRYECQADMKCLGDSHLKNRGKGRESGLGEWTELVELGREEHNA